MPKRPKKMRIKKAKVHFDELKPLTMTRLREIALEILLQEYKEYQQFDGLGFVLKVAALGEKIGVRDNEMQAFYTGIVSISKHRELN